MAGVVEDVPANAHSIVVMGRFASVGMRSRVSTKCFRGDVSTSVLKALESAEVLRVCGYIGCEMCLRCWLRRSLILRGYQSSLNCKGRLIGKRTRTPHLIYVRTEIDALAFPTIAKNSPNMLRSKKKY